MNRRDVKVFFGATLIASLLFLFPVYSGAQDAPKGNIIGFLYAKDGTTPLEGAVVKFKNLTSGTVFESTKSDNYGVFKVEGVEKGLYAYGVVTAEGDFNADNLIGLKVGDNETAKLSISVDPYDKEAAEALAEIYKEQEKSGEALIGTIADFNPTTRIAQIQIMKGVLQVNDKIHARGLTTNFYQDVDELMVGSNRAKRVSQGQTGTLKLDREAQTGDMVYLVRNKKLFPLFLIPMGVAAVIGGNETVTYGMMKIKDQQEPASPKR